jgi:hypothetical protein
MDEQSRALDALAQYFSLLRRGHYVEATPYYGGDYQVLRDWNSTVPPSDRAALFQKGCTVNGMQCLAIRAVVDEQRVSAQEHRFTIKLARELPGEPFTYTCERFGDGALLLSSSCNRRSSLLQ